MVFMLSSMMTRVVNVWLRVEGVESFGGETG